MTETQAKSGVAGTSTNPVDEEAADSGTPATGRAVVGRAAVPAESASTSKPASGAPAGDTSNAAGKGAKPGASGTATPPPSSAPPASGSAAAPKFTRAPGMPPPPADPAQADGHGQATSVSATGKAPVSAPPAGSAAVPGLARPGVTPAAAGTTTQPIAGRTAAGGGSVRTPGAVGAARVGDAVRAARSTVASAASRGPRRARLNVKRIDPWSVMKFSFAVSLVLFIVVIVATSVLYLALDAMGVFESVNSSLTDLVSAGGGEGGSTFRITAKGVIGTSALIGAVNVVLFTALATLGAFIYNVCADLVGGIELTLAERD
ncbi:DUF3566 domain-containing protein [Micromonospora sp. CPCC 206061]|uniref:DUF3566 domain-containing protein n=1 Tax=Micromonospora sp. CPCC 206061 TaxID=3122410 RepID=UPI002FF3FC93